MGIQPYEALTGAGQVRRLRRVAHDALAARGVAVRRLVHLFHGENTTFRAETEVGRLVVRIHRRAYQTPETIDSELAWLHALSDADIPVPAPMPTPDGRLRQTLDGIGLDGPREVVVFRWLSGRFFKVPTAHWFRATGALAARLHAHARAWTRPPGFARGAWDVDGLVGDAASWGAPLEGVPLVPDERQRADQALERVRETLATLPRDPTHFGLVHADLHRGNVLLTGGEARAIDFDDCGDSWWVYDTAVTLAPSPASPNVEPPLRAWLDGYDTIGEPFPRDQLRALPALLAARRMGIASWLVSRSDNPKLKPYVEHGARTLAFAVDALLDGTFDRAVDAVIGAPP